MQYRTPEIDISVFDRLRGEHIMIHEGNAFFEVRWDLVPFRVQVLHNEFKIRVGFGDGDTCVTARAANLVNSHEHLFISTSSSKIT
jgi:hypothetical protein